MSRLSLRGIGRLVSLVAVLSCGRQAARSPSLFKMLSPAQTGITFANAITTTDSVNVQTDVYLYNGAGVAVGDIDNYGLPDVFFAGNMVSSSLYLNKGNMRFEDITESAGVQTTAWATGVTMVDINNDGFLDVYVSVSGAERSQGRDRANRLFINNGDRTFTEAAARYGIADTGFATHAVFVDYDGDGYLDLFLLNNSPQDFGRGAAAEHPLGVQSNTPASYNTLYRNNGDRTFTDELERAAIRRRLENGLGVAYTDWGWSALFGDFDNDGYKDIFITNGYPKATTDLDYQMAVFRARRAGDDRRALSLLQDLPGYRVSNYLFRNNGDLTFTDQTNAWGLDQPGFSYGAAYADLNNDGRLDLVVNNIDAPAFIYENVAPQDAAHHYLQIKLEGEPPNRGGIGSKLILTAGGQKQYVYHSPYRGYMSTVDDRPHFGL